VSEESLLIPSVENLVPGVVEYDDALGFLDAPLLTFPSGLEEISGLKYQTSLHNYHFVASPHGSQLISHIS
jgi:hypothetical protein